MMIRHVRFSENEINLIYIRGCRPPVRTSQDQHLDSTLMDPKEAETLTGVDMKQSALFTAC